MNSRLPIILSMLAVLSLPALADTTFQGTLYYTNYTGGRNVWSITFNYDQTTHTASLGTANNIASLPGADGIIFAANHNLLVAGQGYPYVQEITTAGVPVQNYSTNGQATYHLALSPNGNLVYTSNFQGPLVTINLTNNTTSVNSISGSVDSGLTQIAFAPNGNVFYTDGEPNCCGSVGLLNLNTDTATQLFSSISAAHGIVYDPFTGLITLFGGNSIATLHQDGTGLAQGFNFGGLSACNSYDQGAVDGHGHALIAGCDEITFLDYSGSGDITHPNYVKTFGGFSGIDDVAPLVGPGSQQGTVPEPASLVLFGSGLVGLASRLRRRKA